MASASTVADRLAAAGIALPAAMPAVASYVPFTILRQDKTWLVHVAGQGPFRDGRLLHIGRVGDGIDLSGAQDCARLVALNVLAQADAASRQVEGAPGLNRGRCLRLGVFVHCVDGFAAIDTVADAASSLIELALGAAGRHARTTVGMPVLPMRTAVEIDAVFEFG